MGISLSSCRILRWFSSLISSVVVVAVFVFFCNSLPLLIIFSFLVVLYGIPLNFPVCLAKGSLLDLLTVSDRKVSGYIVLFFQLCIPCSRVVHFLLGVVVVRRQCLCAPVYPPTGCSSRIPCLIQSSISDPFVSRCFCGDVNCPLLFLACSFLFNQSSLVSWLMDWGVSFLV